MARGLYFTFSRELLLAKLVRYWVGLWAFAVVAFLFQADAAKADPYYLYTGQTSAQTQIDSAPHTSTWYLDVTGSFDFGGGRFTIKQNNATENIVLKIYRGTDTNGTLVDSVSLTPADVPGSFTLKTFAFATPKTLTAGKYFITLTSATADNKQYFIKGVDQAIVSLDGTTAISSSIVTPSVNPTSTFLTVAKSVSTTAQFTGNSYTYTVGIGNSGGTGYTGTTVTVLDQLPAGVKATSVSASTGVSAVTCTNLNVAGALLNCSLTLSTAINSGAPNSTAAITINATGPSTAGTLTNYASVDSDGSGNGATAPTPASTCTTANCASAATTFYAPTIATSKTLNSVTRSGTTLASLSGYQVQSGDVLTYRMTTTESSGASTGSASVTLTENAPSNTTYTGSGQGWSGTGPYTQALTINAGQTLTRDFTVTVGTLTDGVTDISNTVWASAGTCSTCTVTTATVPRLTISKTPPGTLATGSTAIYSVVVRNTGGSTTSGTVTFTDTLPSGLTYNAQTAGVSSLTCTAAGQVITCTGTPNIAAGGSVTVSYRVNVSSDATGKLLNTATLTALGGDPRTASGTPATPSAGSSTQSADKLTAMAAQNVTTISTSKTLAKVNGSAYTGGAIKSGDVLTYNVVVQETGGLAAGTVTVSETVPANTSYNGSSEGWTLSGGTYSQDVTVSAGSSVTKTFTVKVGSLADGITSISNTVTSNAGSCSSCTVTTSTVPRLTISKTGPASALRTGEVENYSVTIANNGGSATAGTLTFTDTLPNGLTFASQTAGAPSLTCSASGQVITCSGSPTIAAGGSLTVSYGVNVADSASGTLVNSALLTVLGGDPRTPLNDAANPAAGASSQGSDKLSAKAAQTVATGSLSVTKALASVTRDGSQLTSLTGYQARTGDVLTYSITATESGGSSSATTILTESVPANTSYTGSSEGWTLSGSNYSQTVTAAKGSTVTRTFTVTVGSLADNVTTISNTVTTSAGACTGCTVTLATAPRLAISKSGPATLPAGGTARYTVTLANRGGSATSGALAFTDTLPDGLTFKNQVTGSGSMLCAASGQTITCDNSTSSFSLSAGSTLSVSYDVTVADSASGTLVNGVLFISLGNDPRSPAALNSYADPASGSGNAASDGLSAKSAATVVHGTLSVSKELISANGVAWAAGNKISPSDVLVYEITVQETGGTASASTTLTENAPANTTYSGTGEGWSGSGPYTQSVTVAAGQTVRKRFTVTAGAFANTVLSISNTVATSYGSCVTCTVTDATVNATNGVLSGQVTRKARNGSRKLAGVVVRLYDHAGHLIATTNTDRDGNYSFENLTPDTYSIRFTKPSGSLGFQTDASGSYGINQIDGIVLQAGQTITSLDAVAIDPSGVVYNSVTRQPVANAKVTLRYNGADVPIDWLDQTLGGPNNQITDASGGYNFVLNGNAPSSNSTNAYSLVVVPPANFVFQSTAIPPALTTPYDPGTGGATILIQEQATAPAIGQDTTYYLSFYFNSTTSGGSLTPSNGVANNHIPIDPVASLATTKTLDQVNGSAAPASYQVKSGDVLTYRLTVTNSSSVAGGSTVLGETVPAGTSYSGTGEGWTVSGTDYSQTVSVAAGASETRSFTVTVGPLGDGVGAISNTVSSSAGSCTACTVSVPTVPRLAISKTAPASLAAGGTAEWSVSVSNRGGSPTSGVVTFSDTLPAGLSFAEQTAGSAQLACSAAGQVVTCSGSGAIAAGATVSVRYTTRVAVGASGKLVNAVVLSALGGDPRSPANDAADPAAGSSSQGSDGLSAKAAQSVVGGNLAIKKRIKSINGVEGGKLAASEAVIVYAIDVTETSGQASAHTVLTERVPDNTAYQGTSEGWAVDGADYQQEVTVGAGGTATVYFTVKVNKLTDNVEAVANTVRSSTGDCSECSVSVSVVRVTQAVPAVTRTNTEYTTEPIPDCQARGIQTRLNPQHGTIEFRPDGSSVYIPNKDYVGQDRYTYSVECGSEIEVVLDISVLVVDPAGVVYDAVKRTPVKGAKVTLLAPSGAALSNAFLDLNLGGPNGQVTDEDGKYSLMLRANAPSGVYQLRVEAPAGYQNAPAASIPVAGSLYTPALGGGIEYIQAQSGVPQLADPVPYYLAFDFRLGRTSLAELSNGVAHNHIPLDPAVAPLPLVVTKTTSKRVVGPGDLVPYRITVRTQDGTARGLATVVDILPSGFSYVPGTSTVDGQRIDPIVHGGTLTWGNQIIPATGSKSYDLVLSVGAGVTKGNRTNTALVRGMAGDQISNRAEAAVTIGPDPLFDCTDVIGKVFEDSNGNGSQDEGEHGIANARLATVNGLLVTTDANGRYHIACAATPNGMIGSNFVLKLDEASLPPGYRVAGQNPAGVRLTAGVMRRINFALSAKAFAVDLAAADFGADGQMDEGRASAIVERLRAARANRVPARLRYVRGTDETIDQAVRHLDAAEARLSRDLGTGSAFDRDIVTLKPDGRK